MITCPYCGTNYLIFQSNCKNCGGPLPTVEQPIQYNASKEYLPVPPPAPRPISNSLTWRLLLSDGWSIAAFVFTIFGLVFGPVGTGFTVGILTAFLGIPFLSLGLLFFGTGIVIFIWRYQEKQKTVNVLRIGEAAYGQVTDVHENTSVMVNDNHPWIIRYQFQVDGQVQDGSVTTLNRPGEQLQAGKRICVLYLPADLRSNSLYPHP